MTRAELIDWLQTHKVSDKAAHFVPSSFDPHDPLLAAFPRDITWRWESCERFLRSARPETIVLQVPLFWQLYSPLHTICKDIGCSIYPNEVDNFPIGAAAISSADASAFIIEQSYADAFAAFLSEKNKALPGFWLIIHRPDAEWTSPSRIPTYEYVSQEVHLFPGVPILDQCEHLAETRAFAFHPVAEFEWTFGNPARISSSTKGMRFSDLDMPFGLRETTICPCGRMSVERV